MKNSRWYGIFAFLLVSTLVSCGGSSSGGSTSNVSGLEIADQMSLVESEETSLASLSLTPPKGMKALYSLGKALTSDASTAYFTDPLNIWIFDGSMESLNIINEILCSFAQTRYADMVNQGDYVALVDNALCSQSEDKSSSQNDQSSGTTQDLETWTVNSERADNNSNQIVHFWIEQPASGYDPAMLIHGNVVITEGASAANPEGLFRADFEMFDETGTIAMAQGYIETVERNDGQHEFQFSMTGAGDFNISQSVHLVKGADASAGYAHTEFQENMGGEPRLGSFDVAYNASNYYASGTMNSTPITKCLDKDAFDDAVFRYGVYKADGSRYEIAHPGFGIKYTLDGNTYYGWAGYYGIWLPDNLGATNGLSVDRSNNDTAATYTVVSAPGKLIKHTKVPLTLGDIKNKALKRWIDNANWVVKWNGTNFVKQGIETCANNQPCTISDGPTGIYAPAEYSWENFWRDGFGSLNLVVPAGGALSDSTPITADSQQVMTAADFPSATLTLKCYTQCPRANITSNQLNWQNEETPYLTDSSDLNAPNTYVISASDMTLTYGGQPVQIANGVTSNGQGPNSWGVNSGAMLADISSLNNTWEVWNQDVFYTWETGLEQWNKFTGLVDGNGTAVTFDPPLRLNYTHAATGDDYVLEYAGFGELQGIPWQQTDDAGSERWYPTLTIPNGSEVTDDSGTPYYVRALEMERKMQNAPDACTELQSFTPLTAPDAEYVHPNIGPKPPVTGDPKVIKGELTGS